MNETTNPTNPEGGDPHQPSRFCKWNVDCDSSAVLYHSADGTDATLLIEVEGDDCLVAPDGTNKQTVKTGACAILHGSRIMVFGYDNKKSNGTFRLAR